MPRDLTMHLTGSAGPFEVLDARVREGLSIPTTAWVRLEVRADGTPPDESVLGKTVLLELRNQDDANLRAWHLAVRAIIAKGHVKDAQVYELELDDRFGLLSFRTDVRIFQELTSKEIAAKVFDDAGISSDTVQWRVQRALVKRTYCVQYRETDLAFVERILRHDGIFRIPADELDQAKAIFADSPSAFSALDEESKLLLTDRGHGQGVDELEVEYSVVPDQIALRDWNYEAPAVDLTCDAKLADEVSFALYEFPAGYQTPAEGQALAKIRAEELAAKRAIARGKAAFYTLRPARWFDLEGATDRLAIRWLLREVTHVYSLRAQSNYHNTFVASPHDQPFRPPREAGRPVVAGSHSIKVTGPGEIHTDKLGRMKGKFFWDRVGHEDEKASCWMRVIQLPIGGSQALARVGWEMLVRYAWGDPDRPIAIARVDNGMHTAPYSYPSAATAMSFKTMSSPGGGKFNEFTMEDGGGSMKFGVTAARDVNEQVNHDETEKIGVDEKLEVGTDLSTTIGANQTVNIGAVHSLSVSADAGTQITGDRKKTVGAAETITITGNLTEKITGSDAETVGASHTTMATMGVSRSSQGSHALTVGGSMIQAAALGCSVAVAGSKSETIGGAKLVISGGTVTESTIGALAITVGGAVIHAAGGKRMATATGASNLIVGGAALLNSAGKVHLKAPKIKVTVGGMANVLGGGGIVNITPASVTFLGLISVKGSSTIKISGAPNLAG